MSSQVVFPSAPRMVVGISDLAVTNSPNVFLTTYALGSCVGVLIFSQRLKAAGLLHAMLPTERRKGQSANPLMFVDTGIDALLKELEQFGLAPGNVSIALFGGASVNGTSSFFRIGEENIEIAKEYCRRRGLRIVFEDLGGKVNRTIHFRLHEFSLEIKKPQELKKIKLA